MAFIPTDLYLSSGTAGIFNYWTPSVTKFDSSTFYNWEQDNEPLYDLDERTSLLWDRAGNPIQDGFSGIAGKVFVVSANATFAVNSNSNGMVFRNLSSVLNVLPSRITYPIIIEVASYGDLGDLVLKNIKIDESVPGAGLEIVNRAFGRSTHASEALFNGTTVSAVSSTDLYNSIINSSSIYLSTVVTSSVTDPRWATNRGWISPIPLGYTNYGFGSGYINFNAGLIVDTLNKIKFAPYTATQDATVPSDYFRVSGADGNTYYSSNGIAANNVNCFAAIYGNYLNKVKIENCAGPIYIRNFCVDGGGSTSGVSLAHTTQTGFDITNSKVTLENSFALRCKENGFKFVNSDITVRRGLFAVRNYALSTTSARDTSVTGIGLNSINSVITIEDQTTPITVSGLDIPIHTMFNNIGIKLVNSHLLGKGSLPASSILTASEAPILIQTLCNTECGMHLENSVYKHKGITQASQNYNGIRAYNSMLELPMVVASYNQGIGFEAVNSIIIKNPNTVKVDQSDKFKDISWNIEQFTYGYNGQHLVLNNSQLLYKKTDSTPDKMGTTLFYGVLGVNNVNGTRTHKSGIIVKNNSYADFVQTKIQTLNINTDTYYNSAAVFGTCINVAKNSKARFLGSKSGPTVLLGANEYGTNTAAAVATENSELEFAGVTFIGQAGVDALVEKNSVVKFNPQRTDEGNLDVSGWNLSDGTNHTKVELHSLRACLVADDNSTIVMEDLGDIHSFWPASQTSSMDYNQDNSLNTSAYTASGYLQFYPNGQDEDIVDNQGTRFNLSSTTINTPNDRLFTAGSREFFLVNYKSATASSDILAFSTGGMCVRAVNNSNVKVNNVHFPAGWENCRGIYYDTSATFCERLRIWNICDSSKLHAAYCSVSGLYPSLAGYRGPSSVYVSGASITASGAPAGTPDTGILSVLDYYGASGANLGTNYGPFRLYMSPSGRAKFLTTNASDSGIVYQVLSQGYNPSATCSTISTELSSIYSDITTAKFYYVSSMLDDSYANRIRLDESAADTFANARHNAIQKSGRVPLVTIYRSRNSTSTGSQAFDAGYDKFGNGFKSSEIFDLRRDN
jgi:hypothetical protein